MALNKLVDIINGILGKKPGPQDASKVPKAVVEDIQATMDAIKNKTREFGRAVDDITNQFIDAENKLEDAYKAHDGSAASGAKIQALIDEIDKLKAAASKAELRLKNSQAQEVRALDELSVKYKLKAGVVRDLANGEAENLQQLSLKQRALQSVTKHLGITTDSLDEFASAGAILGAIFAAASEQVVRLNQYMTEFTRNMSGSLNSSDLGFNSSGSNITAGRTGSIESIANANNLSLEAFMKTFDAFSEGQILGVTDNLRASQEELVKYGVTVGRVSKLYGVADGTLASLSKTLSQNYGVKIEDLSGMFERGARIAAAAGLNVNRFFENMQQVANLTGALFIRGGAEGMEKTAFALSKLGLSAASLEHVASSITDFGSLIDKQNRAAALGLSNYSAATARIFAKIQTGDTGGAATMQQVSLAKDIVNRGYTDKAGAVTQQGVASLANLGLGKDEIAGIQRLIQAQARLGISLERLADETKLTSVELGRKRAFEQENSSFTERIGMLWTTIKSTFVDPIAAILGPALNGALSILIGVFKTLGFILRPIIRGFEIFGSWIGILTTKINEFVNYISAVFERIGLGGKGGFAKMTEVIGTLVAVLISMYTFIKLQEAWKKAQALWQKGQDLWVRAQAAKQNATDFIGGLAGRGKGKTAGTGDGKVNIPGMVGGLDPAEMADLFSSEGGTAAKSAGKKGLLSKLGGSLKFSAKGAGIGALIGAGGNLLGDAIGGKTGDNVSAAATGAGYGMAFGPVGAAIGAAVGLIAANWEDISKFLSGIWDSIKGLAGDLWDFFKEASGIGLISRGIDWIGSLFEESNEEQKKQNADRAAIKIANMTGQLNPTEQIAQVTRAAGASSMKVAEAQEQRMAATFSKQYQPTVVVQNDVFGGWKVKASGK